MSTSMRLRTADPQEGTIRAGVMTSSKSGKRRDRKKQEIRRGCRKAMWRRRGRGSSRDPAEMRFPRIERRATRTEARSTERTDAQTDATVPIAFRAQRIPEYAIPPKRRRLPARRIEVFSGFSQTPAPLVNAPMEPAHLLQVAAAGRATKDRRAYPARSMEEQASSRADVATCGR